MKTPMQALGAAIAEVRRQAGLTQTQLGEAIGLDQGNISKIERGRLEATSERLVAISKATGASVGAIWSIAEKQRDSANEPNHPVAVSDEVEVSFQAIRYALGAIVSAIALTKPTVGEAIESGLRNVPVEFQGKDSLVGNLLAAIADARRQPTRKLTDPRAAG